MKLEEAEIKIVLALCDKVQLSGLQAMSEVLRLAGKCQQALQAKPGAKPEAKQEPKQEEAPK